MWGIDIVFKTSLKVPTTKLYEGIFFLFILLSARSVYEVK